MKHILGAVSVLLVLGFQGTSEARIATDEAADAITELVELYDDAISGTISTDVFAEIMTPVLDLTFPFSPGGPIASLAIRTMVYRMAITKGLNSGEASSLQRSRKSSVLMPASDRNM